MPKPPDSTEARVVKALRSAGAITGPQQDAALAALIETKICPRCNGTGKHDPPDETTMCNRCYGSGTEYVIG